MGTLVRRCVYGAAVKEAKQQLIASVTKYNEILRGSAEISVNLKAEGKLRIIIISSSGTTLHKESEFIDDTLFKELMDSNSFEIEMDIRRAGPTKPRVMFWFDKKTHMGNSMGVEFIGDFAEGLTFKFMGFLGLLNIPKSAAIRPVSESTVARMQSLWEDILRMYVGGAMTKSEKRFNLRKYEIDSIFLNVFGNIIKVRED